MNANTFPRFPSGAHIADLLPAYINGALDGQERERVRAHLAACAECAAELTAWQAVAGATQAMAAATPQVAQLAPTLLDAVWARLDALDVTDTAVAPQGASVAEQAAHQASPVANYPQPMRAWLATGARSVAQAWRVAQAQAQLIHIGVWLASALCVACVTLYATALHHYQGGMQTLEVTLPMIAAAGAAFVYGREADPALEVALATPASPRAILLSRIGLVFGYDVALGLAATVIVALTHGENVASAVALWLGPSALLASVALLLSLLLGPLVSVVAAASVWLAQVVQWQNTSGVSVIQLTRAPLWGANWLALAIAAALLLVALLYAPRQERLT